MVATYFEFKLSILKTYREITQNNLIIMYVFCTPILIYVTSIRTHYFQNNHKSTPLIMLHMTTRILTAILNFVSKSITELIK
jgi:hypothetical protein